MFYLSAGHTTTTREVTMNTTAAPTPKARPFAKVHTAKTLSGPVLHLARHDTREALCGRFLDVAQTVRENYPGTHVMDFDCPRCAKVFNRMIADREV
jgi:hypothetical protein